MSRSEGNDSPRFRNNQDGGGGSRPTNPILIGFGIASRMCASSPRPAVADGTTAADARAAFFQNPLALPIRFRGQPNSRRGVWIKRLARDGHAVCFHGENSGSGNKAIPMLVFGSTFERVLLLFSFTASSGGAGQSMRLPAGPTKPRESDPEAASVPGNNASRPARPGCPQRAPPGEQPRDDNQAMSANLRQAGPEAPASFRWLDKASRSAPQTAREQSVPPSTTRHSKLRKPPPFPRRHNTANVLPLSARIVVSGGGAWHARSIPQGPKRSHLFTGFARINDKGKPAQRQANQDQYDEKDYTLLVESEKDFFSFCHGGTTSGRRIPRNRIAEDMKSTVPESGSMDKWNLQAIRNQITVAPGGGVARCTRHSAGRRINRPRRVCFKTAIDSRHA